MIKNERQYRISRAQLERFSEQLHKLKKEHGAMAALHHAAHQSQIESLNAEINEYESLVAGRVSVFTIDSLSELPISLIRARISRRKTQKDLAELLGVKEQQVQRWESEEYEGANFDTLRSVACALDIQFASELVVLKTTSAPQRLVERLAQWGFDKSLLARMLPPESFKAITEGDKSGAALWNGLMGLSAVFGVSLRRLLDQSMFSPLGPSLAVRYKLSASADRQKVDAFTVYAHYIAALACKACPNACLSDLPRSPSGFRSELLLRSKRITLSAVLEIAWSHGIIILPLCYSGAFHGAVWQIGGRYVIAIKQTTGQQARWLFDLLHEIGHIVNMHVSELSAIIETEPIGPKDSDVDDEETVANEWAEDVLFDGRSNEIEAAVSKQCRNNIRLLKGAVEKVADDENMERGILANHMAWRLSTEGMSWWGSAENLQKGSISPAHIVGDYLMKHLELSRLNELDRDMFSKAIAGR